MTWNYRVVKKTYDDGYISFGIYEVFYDDNGNIEACTEEAVPVDADSLEELKETYKMMAEAFEQEVIDYARNNACLRLSESIGREASNSNSRLKAKVN